MDKKYSNITWETPDTVIEGTPVTELPKEIMDYYIQNNYSDKGIPLSAETVKKIAKILNKEEKGIAPWNDWPETKTTV